MTLKRGDICHVAWRVASGGVRILRCGRRGGMVGGATEDAHTAGRARQTAELRVRDLPTLPSTIAAELATNPFFRTTKPAVRAAAERFRGATIDDDLGVFAAIREWKNVF